MLSYFYGDLPALDQKQIAKDLFGTIPKNLVSWLRCCTDLRNICAHYGRLYFRIFTATPAHIPGLEKSAERRLFGAVSGPVHTASLGNAGCGLFRLIAALLPLNMNTG
jgi:abortive infection bacteriophage resistance protein